MAIQTLRTFRRAKDVEILSMKLLESRGLIKAIIDMSKFLEIEFSARKVGDGWVVSVSHEQGHIDFQDPIRIGHIDPDALD